ncbi:MAG: ATP-binding protein [bacterium]|nr:ATP-binding protein [bacterium]
MTFYALTGLINAIPSILLGLFVLLDNPKLQTSKTFFYLSLSLGLWGTAYFFWLISQSAETALLWVRILMVGAIFIPATYFHFIIHFLELFKQKHKLVVTFYLLSLVFALISFTPLFLTGVGHQLSFSFWPSAGPLYLPFLIYFFLTILYATALLYREKRRAPHLKLRQIDILIAGAVLGMIGGATNYPLWYGIPILPVGNIFVVSFSVSIAYAILKHHLFNIKVLLTEVGVAVVLLTIFLFTITGQRDRFFINFLLLGVLALGGYILIKSVRDEVSRREEVERLAKERIEALTELEQRNKNLATLQRISDIVLNESEMKPMAQKILDEIPKQLDSCAGALLSIVKDSQLVAYALSEHQFGHKILSLVGGNLEQYSHPVKKDFNLTHAVLVDKEPHDSDNLSDFISPPISKTVALTVQKLISARHIEAFPLYAGGEPFGVLMFVFTDSKDQVYEKNHSIAKAISDDMSLAIQRAQAYTKLKEANAYLADLDKLKDEFISMASHELNTPLAAIEGYLSMVLDEGMGKIDPKAKEYLNRAYDSSKRLAELILDLLNVSRIEQGRLKMKFTKANFASLVESVIKELQLKADTKKIYLKLEAPEADLPQTFCDPDRIREVFVNLVGNSIKFTEKGGITIKLSHPDDHIRAEVVDTGRGIALDDQKKLFQKFSQVKREIDEHQGTGLGLYISKNFVELHKGTIGVTSEQGKGATFFFEIPVLTAAPKEVAGAMLDKPVNAAQIETGPKGVPAIVAESSKVKV